MTARSVVRIASRASELATVQAESLGVALKQIIPDQKLAFVPVTTTGDRSALQGNLPPSNKNEFVGEIETLLLDNLADLAIHSMKDLPTTIPPGLTVRSVLDRQDPRDVVVGANSLSCLRPQAKLGTSSPRRKALLQFRSKVNNVVSIRGNIDTRLHKLDSGEYDAVVLAAAGLHRLNKEHRIGTYLEPTYFVPAPCQGTLAVEFRSDDTQIREFVSRLQCSRVEAASLCERSIVRTLRADCSSALGVYCEDLGERYCIHTIVLNTDGTEVLELQHSGNDPSQMATEVSTRLLSMGVEKLLHP